MDNVTQFPNKKKWTVDDDGNYIITLKVPVEHAKETISVVKLRGNATVEDLEAMDRGKGEVAKTVHLISELSGLSLTAVRKLKPVDYAVIGEAVGAILGNEP